MKKHDSWKNKPVMICGKQYEINAIGTLVWDGDTWIEVKEDDAGDRYIEMGEEVLYFDPPPQDTTLVPKREQWEIEHELREWLRLQEYSGQSFLTLDHIMRNYTLTPKT